MATSAFAAAIWPGAAAATAAETGATAGVPGPNAPAGAPVAHIASGIPNAVYWASTATCVKTVTA